MTECKANENIATMRLSHCCARNAEGWESTTGETKMARMNKIRQTTSAIAKILFIVPEYSISCIRTDRGRVHRRPAVGLIRCSSHGAPTHIGSGMAGSR